AEPGAVRRPGVGFGRQRAAVGFRGDVYGAVRRVPHAPREGPLPAPAKSTLRRMSVGARAASAVLRFYKAAVSPFLPRACRYEPTCSVYAREAIDRYGFRRG